MDGLHLKEDEAMARLRQGWRALGVVLLFTAACSKTDKAATTASASPDAAANVPAPAPAEVTLNTVKYLELADAIKAQKGNVVVVDVWATYCLPCKKEFPNFVELHDRRA